MNEAVFNTKYFVENHFISVYIEEAFINRTMFAFADL